MHKKYLIFILYFFVLFILNFIVYQNQIYESIIFPHLFTETDIN